MTEKYCPTCKALKPASAFNRDRTRRDGLMNRCRSCEVSKHAAYNQRPQSRHINNPARQNNHYMRKYGITLADYEAMNARQGGKCAICKKQPTKRLVVDHCHTTGRVRALLCVHCNVALGWTENHGLAYLSAYK